MAITETATTPRKRLTNFFSSFSKQPSPTSSLSSRAPPSPMRKFSESMMEENIETAEAMIAKWGNGNTNRTNAPSSEKFNPFSGQDRREAKEFVKCVEGLRRAMDYLVSENPTSPKLVQAQHLMEAATRRLQMKFYRILSRNSQHLKPESISSRSSSSSSEEEEERALLAMSDLKLIAETMISSGNSKECANIYTIMRKSIVDKSLYRMEIESLSASQINKLPPDALRTRVSSWRETAMVTIRSLFREERLLCDHVFSISPKIREACFADIAKDRATSLLRFPELVAGSKRSPEKAFPLLDLYETLEDTLLPDIESIFSDELVLSVRFQAVSSLEKLGKSLHTILSEFESSVHRDSRKPPIQGGIHPLTSRVVDYLSALINYPKTLSRILPDSPPSPGNVFQVPGPSSSSPFSLWLAWIILVLLCKLDSKTELYRDPALSYLFLANNLHFILEKVRETPMYDLLGDEWVVNLEKKVKSYVGSYEKLAWGKVVSSLPENARMEFEKFASAFEEARRRQMSWVVPDGKLRDEIKHSVSRKLVGVYKEFYERHFLRLSEEVNMEVLVRFSPDNLGNYLSDLFHGDDSVSGRSSSSSFSSSSSSSPSSNSPTPRCFFLFYYEFAYM